MSGPVYKLEAAIREAIEISVNKLCRYLSSKNIPFVLMIGWEATESNVEVASYIGARKDEQYGIWFPPNMLSFAVAGKFQRFSVMQAEWLRDWIRNNGNSMESALASIGVNIDSEPLSFKDEDKDEEPKKPEDIHVDEGLLGPFEEYFSKRDHE